MNRTNPNAFERVRKEKGMTKRELAYMSGVSEKTLYLWELHGTGKANFRSLTKVAEALGTDVQAIIC